MLSKLFFVADLPTWALFCELILVALAVILAGARFTRLADTLADRLNLTAGWIGLILLATVTSLPELISGGTATAIDNVDLALGGIFGSCSFNITLIFLLNALWGGGSVLRGAAAAHALTSSLGLALISLALLGILLVDKFAGRPPVAQVTELSWALLILITYLGCMRLVYLYERASNATLHYAARRQPVGTAMVMQLTLMAVAIVAASWWLARLCDILGAHRIELIGRPLGATFVGACFLALSTSLPEIATSISAVRLGNLDLALGNIFGSNMFNICVIPVLKVVSSAKGDALLLGSRGSDGGQDLIAGLLAILLTAIAVGGLAHKSRSETPRHFGLDSILIVVTYVGGMALLLMEAG